MDKSKHPTVLLVEDEWMVALDLAETVRDLGYRVDGPYPNTSRAFNAIAIQLPDVAILDIETADGEVYPLAEALSQAGVPIVFHSGNVAWADLEMRFPDARFCPKPCPPDQLVRTLVSAARGAKPAATAASN